MPANGFDEILKVQVDFAKLKTLLQTQSLKLKKQKEINLKLADQIS